MTDIERYCHEVMRFRKALNLTSVNSEEEFNRRFVTPSLDLGQWLPETGNMLDVGSGMGVPGIPLLIAHKGLHGILVERRKKRAEFLRHVVRTLRLDADVYDADINALPSLGVDVCVARAVADQEMLLEMFTRHVNRGALAVLPVPRESCPAAVDPWVVIGEHFIRAGEPQLVRCYRYGD